MIYVTIIFILFVIAVLIAAPYVFRELRKAADYKPKVNLFGRFSFTDEEWSYVYQKGFVEDESGRKFFDNYSYIISYGKNTPEQSQREILFTSQEIYLTGGENVKTFTVNRINYFKNGFKLNSIDLLHLSPLKKLRIKIDAVGVSPESSQLDFTLEYLVPIPQSSLEKIDEIIKAYGQIISDY